jgi:hypothetical protein
VSIVGSLFFAAVGAAVPYPTQAVLAGFGSVCLHSAEHTEEYQVTLERWQQRAKSDGWMPFEEPPTPDADAGYRGNAAYIVFHRLQALDYDLFTSFLMNNEQRQRAVFLRSIAGRDVYLSLFGTTDGGRTLAECRLHDPLGDGITTNPFTRSEVERWVEQPVRATSSWYESTAFSWRQPKDKLRSIRVHFGLKGVKPLGVSRTRYDPYAQYGVTLVRSDQNNEVIIQR